LTEHDVFVIFKLKESYEIEPQPEEFFAIRMAVVITATAKSAIIIQTKVGGMIGIKCWLKRRTKRLAVLPLAL